MPFSPATPLRAAAASPTFDFGCDRSRPSKCSSRPKGSTLASRGACPAVASGGCRASLASPTWWRCSSRGVRHSCGGARR
eukprot:3369423-Prymnesium_polylepis.1